MGSLHPPLAWTVGLSLAISLFPWGKYAVYPFRLFTTWVHECCHAIAALGLGGQVTRITLSPDTSGLTFYRIPKGRLRQAVVASSGYLGSALAGCLIYAGTLHWPAAGRERMIASSLGVLMWLSAFLWVRGLFGLLTVGAGGAALIALGQSPSIGSSARYLIPFLGVQTALQCLFDLRTLFELDPDAHSDARTLQALFWLPSGFWAMIWIGLSLFMMGWTIRWT